MKLLLSVILCSIYINASASAYFLEPFIGYQFSNQRTEITNDESILVADETSFETSGLAVGVRTGIFLLSNTAIGLDLKYSYSSGEGQGVDSDETEIERDLSELTAFGTITYFDGPFKYWAGIGLYGNYSDSGKYNEDGSESLQIGKSYKLGVGYYFLPGVSLNLDFESVETSQSDESNSYTAITNYPLGDGSIKNALISIGIRL